MSIIPIDPALYSAEKPDLQAMMVDFVNRHPASAGVRIRLWFAPVRV